MFAWLQRLSRILRETVSGDLYIHETNQLYRLSSASIHVRALFNISTRLNVGTGSHELELGITKEIRMLK